MTNLANKQISIGLVQEITKALEGRGLPAPGRILLCIPSGEQITQGGIIVPGNQEKEFNRKGVVIQCGQLDTLSNSIVPGQIVTFGMYAGKEIEFNPEHLPMVDFDNYRFTIISESEVIYIESNFNN